MYYDQGAGHRTVGSLAAPGVLPHLDDEIPHPVLDDPGQGPTPGRQLRVVEDPGEHPLQQRHLAVEVAGIDAAVEGGGLRLPAVVDRGQGEGRHSRGVGPCGVRVDSPRCEGFPAPAAHRTDAVDERALVSSAQLPCGRFAAGHEDAGVREEEAPQLVAGQVVPYPQLVAAPGEVESDEKADVERLPVAGGVLLVSARAPVDEVDDPLLRLVMGGGGEKEDAVRRTVLDEMARGFEQGGDPTGRGPTRGQRRDHRGGVVVCLQHHRLFGKLGVGALQDRGQVPPRTHLPVHAPAQGYLQLPSFIEAPAQPLPGAGVDPEARNIEGCDGVLALGLADRRLPRLDEENGSGPEGGRPQPVEAAVELHENGAALELAPVQLRPLAAAGVHQRQAQACGGKGGGAHEVGPHAQEGNRQAGLFDREGGAAVHRHADQVLLSAHVGQPEIAEAVFDQAGSRGGARITDDARAVRGQEFNVGGEPGGLVGGRDLGQRKAEGRGEQEAGCPHAAG